MIHKLVLFLLSFALFSQIVFAKQGGAISLTDIAGRTVNLPAPAQTVVLGEGRFMAVLGVLGISSPVDRLAGMMNEFRVFDPNTFGLYAQAFPEIEQIPTFGHTSEDSVSVEQIILLNPDVAIFGLDGHGPGARSHHITEQLKAAGIPIVFIDFRQDPIANTARSVEIVAQVMGVPEKGKDFAEHYQSRLEMIRSRVASISDNARPRVFLDLRVDSASPCCFSVSEGLFATMAEFAGGYNIAKEALDSRIGQLNLEYVLTAEMDIYIGTAFGAPGEAGNGSEAPEGSKKQAHYERIVSGASVSRQQARESLRQTLESRGLSVIEPVSTGRAYGLWHHFYNSPLNLYAIEKMASWFHPEVFADVEPEQTLARLLSGFAPLDLSGQYSASLHSSR